MAANDAFDFSRFFGGNMGFGMPGIVTPTLDVDELDKKIKDLKAVEAWLSMNLSMLQMSIQGLEVQRNTLSSLKAMGEAFNQSMSDVRQAAQDNAQTHAADAKTDSSRQPSEGSSTAEAVWPWDFAAQAMANLQQQIHDSAENTASDGNVDAAKKSTRPKKPKPEET
jgi:peptidoglycan hydrolase CwlO-like protein